MPSPFPGMNPYLEHEDAWQDFHDTLLPRLRAVLTPQLSPRYIAKVEEHLFIHEPAAEQRVLIGHGDVSVAQRGEGTVGGGGAATIAAPARIRIPTVDIEKHLFLEIRDRQSRELVTVLEVLSPTNKRPGPDREQYLAKRAKLLHSTANFVEIDLLRGWARMPMEPPPDCAYGIMVSNVEDRPFANFWPLSLRERLPVIPVPLRTGTPDASIDLQAALHHVYDEAAYQDYVYRTAPMPPLSDADARWAQAIIARSSGE